MIKEFFKSTFRTLGRVFAYVVLGILAYFILTWFGITKAKAEIFEEPNYTTLYGSGATTTVCYNQVVCPNDRIIPNSTPFTNIHFNYGYTLSNNTYQYSFTGQIITTTDLGSSSSDISSNIGYSIEVISGNTIQTATCDSDCEVNYYYRGRSNYYISSTSGTTTLSGYIYEITLEGKLNVSGTYDTFRFNMWSGRVIAATPYSYLLVNDDSLSDSEAIIDNANKNTQDVINNQNNNTTIINNNLSDINNSLTDETPADFGILEDIKDYMPSNAPLTSIITLPLTILALEINSLNGTCNAWTINTGSLLGNNTWTIPCINPGRYLTGYSWGGYDLWNLIDFMFCMFMGYEILMLIISAWEDITSLEDTFDGLYQPRHKGYKTQHNGERV